MSGNPLAKSLATWIKTTLNAPGAAAPDHCFELRPQFRIPGAGSVDLLTCRHDKGRPDRFRVDLWIIVGRPLGDADTDPMLRRIHAFQAWYCDLVEAAETQGFSPDHRVSLSGNLVGTALRNSPLMKLLSQSGSSLFFWEWRRVRGVFEVRPAYGRPPARGAARTKLKGLLDHLPWHDTAEREERLSRAKAGQPSRG
jgi:hypothetical protein